MLHVFGLWEEPQRNMQTPYKKEIGKGIKPRTFMLWADSVTPPDPSREGVGGGHTWWQGIPSFIPFGGDLPAAGLFPLNPKRSEAEGVKGGWVTLHIHWYWCLSIARSGLLCARIYHLRSGQWVILPIPRTDCTQAADMPTFSFSQDVWVQSWRS